MAKQQEKKTRVEMKQRKLLEKEAKNLFFEDSQRKRPINVKSYPKRKKTCAILVDNPVHDDICLVCTGHYLNDINKETGLVMGGRDWIQCTDEECGVWSHVECLDVSSGSYICAKCQQEFV